MENDVVYVAFTCADGRLCIMQFITNMRRSPNGPSVLREATDTNILEEFRRSNQQPVSWRRISRADLPINRHFREAWKDQGVGNIAHDIEKVKNIAVERCRRDRDKKLDALDRDWMKAFGQGKKPIADSVEEERQKLRDLPAALTADLTSAQTVEDVLSICALKGADVITDHV